MYILLAILSVQCSASLAKSLFHLVTPQGVTALRLGFAALILMTILRPWRRPIPHGAWRHIIAYGLALAFMNISFYLCIARIPLGVAVAIEFCGPLTMATLDSRSKRDLLWVGLAVIGVLLLMPFSEVNASLDMVGVFFGFCSGLGWALYIIFGKKAGAAIHDTDSVALGTTIAALVALPTGLISSGTAIFATDILPYGLLVGIFSSALPYSLEMMGMVRLKTQTYGVLSSLEPAIASLSGFIFLGERLTPLQWIAVLCVMTASTGATLGKK